MEDLKDILTTSKTIAVVGLSDKPDRPSYQVASYLQGAGYKIIPVNPMITATLGTKAFRDLRAVPERVDIVQVFRRTEAVPPIVEDAIAIGAKVVWMQTGIVNETAAARGRAAGLQVVMDTCMMVAHRTLRARGLI